MRSVYLHANLAKKVDALTWLGRSEFFAVFKPPKAWKKDVIEEVRHPLLSWNNHRQAVQEMRLAQCHASVCVSPWQRLSTNFLNFRSNYLMILTGCLAFTIFTSPLTIFILVLCVSAFLVLLAWKKPIEVFGRQLDGTDKLYIASGCECGPLLERCIGVPVARLALRLVARVGRDCSWFTVCSEHSML
jgi:hypothetical protein